MTLYSRSDLASVTVSAEAHGGCGAVHTRPAPGGNPVAVWQLTCGPCEDHLRHDQHWSTTTSEIPETYDEQRSREDFERRGAKDKDAVMTLAIARIAGLSAAELPESLTRMVSGAPLHVPVAGQLECPNGHASPAGQKFCGECGAPMSGTVAQAALPAAQGGRKARPPKLREARLDELQTLARKNRLGTGGTRAELITRLSGAGVTSAALAELRAA